MSKWVNDIAEMHKKFGVNEAVKKLAPEVLKEFLRFRIDCVQEELDELKAAVLEENADDAVDALIDLCVFAIGTLNVFDVDADKAWDLVLEKNMQKSPGSNPNRPNKYSLPDMIKPKDFVPPYHGDNIGLLEKAFGK